MSYFDDASLVMIPSGTKTSKVYSVKPIDGTGDLTFTRSNDTASRVASNGLIEKVRTNLILQSNTFSNASWGKNSCTVTSGQAGYDGSTNAWLLSSTATAGSSYVSQGYTSSTIVTRSVYAKAGSSNWLAMFTTGNLRAYFDLQNGVIGTLSAGVTAKIESVGNGFYRCSASQSTGDSMFLFVANADNDSNTNTGDNILIQAAQLETGDIATEPILTTTAAVSVGPVANVPRLDYLGSSCPRLLLEPQRQNLVTFSESFDNAAWNKYLTTITENNIVSPSGYQDADLATSTAGGDMKNILTLATSTTYTASFYVKKGTAADAQYRVYNFDAGVNVVPATSYISQTSTSDWSRISFTFTTGATGTSYGIYLLENSSAGTMYFWGAQLEAGAYATSYINTLNSAVTRGADQCYKTGIGSLFGASAGTIYFETTYYPETNTGGGERFVYAQGNTSSDYVRLWQDLVGGSKRIRALVGAGGVQVANLSVAATLVGLSDTTSGTLKFALAYENNRFQMYVNGIDAALDTSGTAPALTEINFNNTFLTLMPLAQALVFPTALTNAQLAELTTL
jgi:hypothetical protein